jgi:hypothetical protein
MELLIRPTEILFAQAICRIKLCRAPPNCPPAGTSVKSSVGGAAIFYSRIMRATMSDQSFTFLRGTLLADDKLYKAEYLGSGTFVISKPKRKKIKVRQSQLRNPRRGSRKS